MQENAYVQPHLKKPFTSLNAAVYLHALPFLYFQF